MEKKGKKCPAHQIARKKNSWWPEITHPSPQELNGRPLTEKYLLISRVFGLYCKFRILVFFPSIHGPCASRLGHKSMEKNEDP